MVQATAVRRALLTQQPSDFNPSQLLEELISVSQSKGMKDRLENLRAEFERMLITEETATEEEGGGREEINVETRTLGELDKDFEIDMSALQSLVPNTRPGSGLGFQIASIDAIPCVVWIVIRYAKNRPSEALSRAISIGGDTDTIASMVGAIVGALHGTGMRYEVQVEQEGGRGGEVSGSNKGVVVSSGSGGGGGGAKIEHGWLPSHLINDLENGERGRDYAIQLATRLCDLDL
jgi:hypothetical protein